MSMVESSAADSRQFENPDKPTPEIDVQDMRNCFVLDGLPCVPADKAASLLQVICNRIKPSGILMKSFEMPTDASDGGTCGYMFVECVSREDCDKAFSLLHDTHLDAAHKLKVSLWGDFESSKNVKELTKTDKRLELEESDDPYEFLRDKTGREQFLVKYGASYRVHIFWHDPHMSTKQIPITLPAGSPVDEDKVIATAPPEWTLLDRLRKRVQKDYPKWSPLGTYVSAIEEHCASIWFLKNNVWCRAVDFDHPKILHFEIGPMEKHAITISQSECRLWDISLCKVIKVFPLRGSEGNLPEFGWNYNETFLLYHRQGKINLYEISSMEKVPLPNLEKDAKVVFSWAPESSILFYSVEPNKVERPVRIYAHLVGTGASLTEISTRSVYGVTNIEMNWQSKETKADRIYCAIIMRATNSQRKDKIDLYRFGGKEIGIDQIEVPGNIISLEWDKSGLFGSRFCVCSTMKKNTRRGTNRFDFYHVQLGNLRLIKSLEEQASNVLFWSPNGTHAVAKNDAGTLEFYRIDTDNVTQLLLQEHYNCTHAAWDPSGRYFVTSIPIHSTEIDTGYRIYNFLGQLLHHAEIEKFSHIQWRPRPHEFLAIKEQQDILKNLDTRIREFKDHEERRRMRDQEHAQKALDELITRHRNVMNEIRKDHAVDTVTRSKLREGLPTLENLSIFDEVPKVKETILDVKETVY
ncbi:eukaryotic translation initiation factor 3 subunit [Perkinsela sp. CCAP 1560/4]|nr:eukaryotic translation initiation factor 3 subunit [Perkinsela sp. CCAP 1560/4]|eukprot:KNH05246.1 eukaryotic translation initiation factor 3 subunit [Perkinsela sp. CCAP 1560/4]